MDVIVHLKVGTCKDAGAINKLNSQLIIIDIYIYYLFNL